MTAESASDGPTPDQPKTHRREPLDTAGRERPRFLLDYPEDPELDQLIAAFEAGDYALVRKLAPQVIEHGPSRAVRDAAREIRRRIDPDPLIRYLLFVAIGLLVFLVAFVYSTRAP
jgi:hypothetical protein